MFKKPDFSKLKGSLPPALMTPAQIEEKMALIVEKEPVKLTGLVWKRRGGMGRYAMTSSGNQWELRKMELRGTCLLYYSNVDSSKSNGNSSEAAAGGASEEFKGEQAAAAATSSPSNWLVQAREQAKAAVSKNIIRLNENDPTVPRGYLDFAEEKGMVHCSMGHSGSPSPFCLSIVVGLTADTKWKLAFDHQADQMKWLAALSDVVVQCSIDDYNQQLLLAADPNYQSKSSEPVFLRPSPVYEPRDGKTTEALNNQQQQQQQQKQGHRLWIREDYQIKCIDNVVTEEDPSNQEEEDHKQLHQAEIEKIKKEYEKKLEYAQGSVEALENTMKIMQQKHDERVNKLKRETLQVVAEYKQKMSESSDNDFVSPTDGTDIDRMEEYQREIELLKEQLEEAKLSAANAADAVPKSVDKNAAEALKKLESKYQTEREQMLAEHKQVRITLEEKIHSLQTRLESAQNAQEEAIESMEAEYQQRKIMQEQNLEIMMSEVRGTVEGPLQAELEEKRKQIAKLQAEVKSLQQNMKDQAKSLSEALEMTKQKYQESIESVKKDYQTQLDSKAMEIKELEQQHKQAINSLKDEYEIKLQNQKKELERIPIPVVHDDDDEFVDAIDEFN